MNTVHKELLIKLVEAGIQAPSADNCQPWKFKLLDDGFELWLDPANMGLFFDVNQVATQISCGALIENVTVLAKALGLETHIALSASKDPINLQAPNKFAQLTFTSISNQADAETASQTIFNRHTSRNLFQFNKKIPDNLITELSDLVPSDQNYRLHTYQTPKDKKKLLHTITATETIRFINQQVHEDFYKVLRFGDSAQQTRDGLATATLGIESFMIPILAQLSPWFVTRLLNYIGLHRIMAFRGTWLPMMSASHIVSLVHAGPADYVESGRIMQRLWLQANKLGLSVQALGVTSLFFARLHLKKGEGFTPTQLKTLTALEDDFANITPEFNKETDQLIMLFRLGYEKKPASRSYRRPTKSFLI